MVIEVGFPESPWVGRREVVYGGHKVICDAIAFVNDGLSEHPSWWLRDDQFMMAFVEQAWPIRAFRLYCWCKVDHFLRVWYKYYFIKYYDEELTEL